MTTNKPEVKRYDCTSGGAHHCYGCYSMEEGELGDYVEWEAYEALQAECDALVESLEQGFPLLSDEGLDEVEHHCEYVIQRERKRVHSILTAHRALAPFRNKESK